MFSKLKSLSEILIEKENNIYLYNKTKHKQSFKSNTSLQIHNFSIQIIKLWN